MAEDAPVSEPVNVEFLGACSPIEIELVHMTDTMKSDKDDLKDFVVLGVVALFLLLLVVLAAARL